MFGTTLGRFDMRIGIVDGLNPSGLYGETRKRIQVDQPLG